MTRPIHLECGACARTHAADRVYGVSPCCGKPLLARYDLEAVKERVTRGALERGDATMWRFRDVLPLTDPAREVTLGEGMTPLLAVPRLADAAGFRRVLVKEEGLNPFGAFKARGMSAAVSKATELGVTAFAAPTAGNAGVALAAYAARAGASAYVAMPRDVPATIHRNAVDLGAEVDLVDGLITDAGKRVAARVAEADAKGDVVLDVSTLKEPYRVEGKKIMGYEVVMQNDWEVPDVILYPTGGGTGIVGMWKAFDEMEALGLIGSERPRLVVVQSDGCAPMVRAFHAGADHADPWEGAETHAHGLRVPRAIGDFLVLRALRNTRGTAVAVPDAAMVDAQREMRRLTGMNPSLEGAAPLAGLRALADAGAVSRDETVILFNTGSASAYG